MTRKPVSNYFRTLILIVPIIMILALLPSGAVDAQKGRDLLVVHALQCPFGFTGQDLNKTCVDPAGGRTFRLTQDPARSAEQITTVVSADDGTITYPLTPGNTTVAIDGPRFNVAEGRPLLRAECVDEAGQAVEAAGGNPGTTYELRNIPEGLTIECFWYVGQDVGEISGWQGGFGDLKPGVYPGDFVSVYGANSDYPSAHLTIDLAWVDYHGKTLTIEGIDDELEAQVDIEILVNDTTVFSGPSDFPQSTEGMEEPGVMEIEVSPEAFVEGENTVTVNNLRPDANFGEPPWVLLGDTSLVVIPREPGSAA